MRELVRRARAHIHHILASSAWAPLAGKAGGIAAALLLLAAIGAGRFDRTLDLGPARAEAAQPRRARAPKPDASSSATDAKGAPSPAASASARAQAPRTIVLNQATAAELETLPGVGPAKAQAIVALREKLGGRFKRFEDLLRVRGIKRRALLKIREHAVLDPPAPDAPPSAVPPAAGAPSSGSAARPFTAPEVGARPSTPSPAAAAAVVVAPQP